MSGKNCHFWIEIRESILFLIMLIDFFIFFQILEIIVRTP